MTTTMKGRCHTIQYDQKMGVDVEKDSLIIGLKPNLSYVFFLHQPGFFLFTLNSYTLPAFNLVLDQNNIGDTTMTVLMIEVVKHEKLSRPGSLCEEKLTYNFTDCVKSSVSNEVGCKLPWDKKTTG